MEKDFHKSKLLSKEELRTLMKRNNNPATWRFVVMYLLFIGSSAWVVLSWNGAWWNVLLAQLCFGVLCCSTFAALHETAHGTAFQSKKRNQFAAFLAGLAHIYPSTIFRELHFTHHRHTHILGLDPEISLGNKPAPQILQNPPLYLAWVTGLPLFLFKLNMLLMGALGMPEPIRKRLFPFVRPKMRAKIALESLFVLAVYVGVFWLAYFVHAGFWGILVGQVVGHCILSSYLVMEHNGLPHEGNILERTRSIPSPTFVKWVMWNMPYHAEHHAYPAVPFHALPELHKALKNELKHQTETPSTFHANAVKRFLFKKR